MLRVLRLVAKFVVGSCALGGLFRGQEAEEGGEDDYNEDQAEEEEEEEEEQKKSC